MSPRRALANTTQLAHGARRMCVAKLAAARGPRPVRLARERTSGGSATNHAVQHKHTRDCALEVYENYTFGSVGMGNLLVDGTGKLSLGGCRSLSDAHYQ